MIEREMNRQGAKDAKILSSSWRPWRFEVLLVSGGFNPFVALAVKHHQGPLGAAGALASEGARGGAPSRSTLTATAAPDPGFVGLL
ncbi:hypothetical protein WMF38_53055 [Sorangium sp. So ce118]